MRNVNVGWIVVIAAACGSKSAPANEVSSLSNHAEPSGEAPELVAFRTEMCACRDIACTEDVHARHTTWSTKPTSTDAAYNDCRAKGSGVSESMPEECRAYAIAIHELSTCDKLPKETRDALKHSFEQTAAAWSDVPAEERQELATACKAAADAVLQSAAACN